MPSIFAYTSFFFLFQNKYKKNHGQAGKLGRSGMINNFFFFFLLGLSVLLLVTWLIYYRKRGSASYIVREVRSARERDTERERERERERESETEVTSLQ